MDVEERIFEKLDVIEERLSRLCDRVTKIEAAHKHHIDSMISNQNRKLRNRDYMIALFGMGLGILTALQILGVV